MADLRFPLNPRQKQATEILSDHTKTRVCFYGGRRSGKTFLFVHAIFKRAMDYPGSPHLILRLARARADATVWTETVLPIAQQLENEGLCKISYSKLTVTFPNGSYIRIEGMEPHRISGLLALQYATAFITECREVKWVDVEKVTTGLNCNSRNARGQKITPKLFCDLNPGPETSWPYQYYERKLDPSTGEPHRDADKIASMHFRPEDNIGFGIEEEFVDTLKSLGSDAKKQFYEGTYGRFEGVILPLRGEHGKHPHIIDEFKLPPWEDRRNWTFIRAVDFGFHPDAFCCLWMALDKRRNCLVIYRERYKRKVLVSDHARRIREATAEDFAQMAPYDYATVARISSGDQTAAESMISATMCDHDSGDQATLTAGGISTTNASKNRRQGIQLMIEVFEAEPGQGKPRIEIVMNCTNTISEASAWRWKDTTATARKANDMETEGEDHAMDPLRYGLMRLFPKLITGNFNPVVRVRG